MRSAKTSLGPVTLRGMLETFDWVTVTRESPDKVPAAGDEVVHNIRSTEDIIDAYGRRQRGPKAS